MTPERVKEILQIYRPGTVDDQDPEMAEAIRVARADDSLRHWFEEHCAFQNAMRAKLRSAEVPAGLRDAILARQKIVTVPFWQQRGSLLAAAAAFILLGLVAGYTWWQQGTDRFANFQDRMLGAAVREYRMDVETNNMDAVRGYLASTGAPSDYEIPAGLSHLKLTGGGRLTWRNHPVSMVCFNRGDNQMIFLFVLNTRDVANPPPSVPIGRNIGSMTSGSWTQGDKSYFLLGPNESDFTHKYF